MAAGLPFPPPHLEDVESLHTISFGSLSIAQVLPSISSPKKNEQPSPINPIHSFPDPAPMSNVDKPLQACNLSHSSTHLSYADTVRGISDPGRLKEPEVPIIELTTLPSTYQGKPAVLFPLMAKQLLVKRLKFVLVGKFSHGRPSLRSVKMFFVKLKLIGDINITVYDSKHLFLECSCKEDFYRIWLRLTWLIEGMPMRVFKWFPDFSPYKESSIAPVWTNVAGLPLYMFEQSSLLSIAKAAGSPIKVDSRNLNRSIVNTAWICIELDVQKQLVDDVWVSFVDENGKELLDGFWINFSYPVVPPFCSLCQHIGHTSDFCKRKIEQEAQVTAMDFTKALQIDLTFGHSLAMETQGKAPLSRSFIPGQVQVEVDMMHSVQKNSFHPSYLQAVQYNKEGSAPVGGTEGEAVAGHAYTGAFIVAEHVVEAAAETCAHPAAEADEDPAGEEAAPAAETGAGPAKKAVVAGNVVAEPVVEAGADPAKKSAAGNANAGRKGMSEDCRENIAEYTKHSPFNHTLLVHSCAKGFKQVGVGEEDVGSHVKGMQQVVGMLVNGSRAWADYDAALGLDTVFSKHEDVHTNTQLHGKAANGEQDQGQPSWPVLVVQELQEEEKQKDRPAAPDRCGQNLAVAPGPGFYTTEELIQERKIGTSVSGQLQKTDLVQASLSRPVFAARNPACEQNVGDVLIEEEVLQQNVAHAIKSAGTTTHTEADHHLLDSDIGRNEAVLVEKEEKQDVKELITRMHVPPGAAPKRQGEQGTTDSRGAITPQKLSSAAAEFTPKWAVLVKELVEDKKQSDPVLIEKEVEQHGSQVTRYGSPFLSDGMGDIICAFKCKSVPNSPSRSRKQSKSIYDSPVYSPATIALCKKYGSDTSDDFDGSWEDYD